MADIFEGIPFVRTEKPVTVLSENETFDDINKICSCVREVAKDGGNLSGIIITHGTDSLAFFATAAALMLCDLNVPVVVVSADLPLSEKSSNGKDNMLGAYGFICSSPEGGVYVAYKNAGENVKIHYGARLNLTRGFDGYVSSAADKICGYIDGDGKFVSVNKRIKTAVTDIQPTSTDIQTSTPYLKNLKEESENKTRFVVPYVGLDYIALNRAAEADGAEIMLDSFHSGTLKTHGENSVNALTVPVFSAGKSGGNSYESELFLSKNVKCYKNISPIALYFKLVLSRGLDAKTREKYLSADVSGEYF